MDDKPTDEAVGLANNEKPHHHQDNADTNAGQDKERPQPKPTAVKGKKPKKSSGKPAQKIKPVPQPCGIPGVTYTLDYVKKLDSATSHLAGAFHFEDSSEVWTLYKADKSTKPWLDGYIAARSNAFGWQPKQAVKKYDTINPKFLGTIWTDERYRAMLVNPQCPAQGDAEVTEKTMTTWGTAWYTFQLMRARPDLFPKSKVEGNQVTVEPHDWLHGWKLMSFIRGQVNKGLVPATGQQGDPSVPEIYVDPALSSTEGESATRQSAASTMEQIIGLTENEFASFTESFEEDEDNRRDEKSAISNEGLDFAADLVRELAKTVEMSMDPKQQREIVRAPMSDAQRASLIRLLVHSSDRFVTSCVKWEPLDTMVSDEEVDSHPVEPMENLDNAPELDDEGVQQLQKARELICKHGHQDLSYEDACGQFNINPTTQVATLDKAGKTTLVLKRHQVTGVKFTSDQENGPVRGGMIADACGLGKTTQMLAYLAMVTRDLTKDAAPFQPTLVLCPPAVIDTWYDEWAKRFKEIFTLRLFHGSRKHTSNVRRQELIIDEVTELQQWMGALDATDPRTARTIVLSSYQTWSKRTTSEGEDDGEKTTATISRRPKRDQEKPWFNDADESLPTRDSQEELQAAVEALAKLQEVADDEEEEPKAKARRIRYNSSMGGRFIRVVCDEGHAVKTIRSRQHQSVALLQARHLWFLSATPMSNKPTDMLGYLTLL
ncbi:uncharacterized protein BDV14DRAFT_206514, partial [Aspergillus stella-maris]|uniref:uncharacterized protein n=1 Tax=Aspergillus stella-maris TaxID=1810926 RepID=UPI003CCCD60C